MNRRFPKQLFRFSIVCLVLALPIIGTVIAHVREAQSQITGISREKTGLQASLVADDLLVGIERYRIFLLDRAPSAATERKGAAAAVSLALAQLDEDPWRTVSDAGPRSGVTELQTRWDQIGAIPSRTERGIATIPLAESVLLLLLDIDDASGLTYDPTVASVNLSDALVARLPSQSERRDRSAELIELAAARGRVHPFDINAAEMSAGESRDALAQAIDDLDGGAQAIPELEQALRVDRADLERRADALTLAINALALSDDPNHGRNMQARRLASVHASNHLLRSSEALLATTFDQRIAALTLSIRIAIGLGVLGLGLSFSLIAVVLHAMRRRAQGQVDRANERAAALEATLARRNAERTLRMTEQQFRAVFEGSPVGIAIIARTGRLLEANDVFHAMFDHGAAAILDIAKPMFAELELGHGTALSSEHYFDTPGRDPIWTEVSLSLIRAEADDSVSAIVMVHDITAHKTLYAQLDHDNLHDTLTKLPNRVFFMRRLHELIATPDARFAVVFIDLDRFKSVNDTLGHHAGDRVLLRAAQRLAEAVRGCDFVARLHGDEFALLLDDLPDDGETEIDAIAARMTRALRIPVDTLADPIIVSGSIGIVRSTDEPRDAEQYLRDADAAMYRSKLRGGGCVTFYDANAMDDINSIGAAAFVPSFVDAMPTQE